MAVFACTALGNAWGQIPTNGLVAHYPFNGNANDESGNGNNGTTIFGTVLANNRFNNSMNSYSFNGVNSVIKFSKPVTTVIGTWSISAWLKPSELLSDRFAVFVGYDDGTIANGYGLGISNTAQINVLIANKSYYASNYVIPNVLNWNFLTISRNEQTSTLLMYVNGQLVTTVTSTIPYVPENFVIGAAGYTNNASLNRYFSGLIDDIRVYNRALNTSEIQSLYTEGCDTYFAQSPIVSFTGSNLVVNTYAGVNYQWSYNNSTLLGATSPAFNGTLSAGTYTVTITNVACQATSTFIYTEYDIVPIAVNDCSTLPFVIPIQTGTNISQGIIGLDIELTYNPAIMTPTGVAYLGAVVTTLGEGVVSTHTNGSVLNLNISYNGQGELSGSGVIVSPEFLLAPGTLAAVYTIGGGNIRESYVTYDVDVTFKNETFTVLHYLPTFTGHVLHWNNVANPVINNINTLSGVLTATALNNCVNLAKTSGTNASGSFSVEMGEGNYGISIKRDVPNFAPVMDVLNGFDAMLITKIRNGSLPNPTVEQLIAADVNATGSVTSGDRTLLRRRILMQDVQLPNGVPDWRFYKSNTTFTGFNKNSIPAVLTCIPLDSYIENGCVKLNNDSFTGILMGDVDGSYATNFAEGQNLREESIGEVIYDLSAATTDAAGITDLPVRLNYTGVVYSLDAMIEYDDKALKIQSVSLKDEKNSKTSEPVGYNHFKQNLLLATVDNEKGFETESYFLRIKLKKQKTELKAADLGKLSAYINGKKVSAVAREEAETSTTTFDLTSIKLFPNPSETGVFYLELVNSSKVSYTVLSQLGNSITSGSLVASASQATLDLSNLPSGVYFIKLSSGDNVVVKKLVID